jgi:hypothetical protein
MSRPSEAAYPILQVESRGMTDTWVVLCSWITLWVLLKSTIRAACRLLRPSDPSENSNMKQASRTWSSSDITGTMGSTSLMNGGWSSSNSANSFPLVASEPITKTARPNVRSRLFSSGPDGRHQPRQFVAICGETMQPIFGGLKKSPLCPLVAVMRSTCHFLP